MERRVSPPHTSRGTKWYYGTGTAFKQLAVVVLPSSVHGLYTIMWFYGTNLSNRAHAYVQNLSCFCCIVSRCFGGVSQRYEVAVQANSRGLRFRAALRWSDWGLSVWCLTFGPLPWTASIPALFVFPISSVGTSQGEWTQSLRLSDWLLIYLSLYLNLSFSCPFRLCLQLSLLVLV